MARALGLPSSPTRHGPCRTSFSSSPPLYAGRRQSHESTGLPLESAGRLVSALAIAPGGCGLAYGLARRGLGARPAILALLAFVVFPVTVRLLGVRFSRTP